MVKNCNRGLENKLNLEKLTEILTFSIFFSCIKLALHITNGFVYAALVIQWACAPSTNDS